MSKAKLFLYDFVTNRKIIKYGIASALFLVAALYYRHSHPAALLDGAAMSGIGLSMAFMTTLYSILAYSTMDKIRAYLMLPCKRSEVFFAFIFAQYFSLLLERMSFVMIVALLFTQNPGVIIAYLVLSALIAVILDMVIVMSMNRKRIWLAVIPVLIIAALYLLLIRSQNALVNLSVLVCLVLIGISFLSGFEPRHLAISRQSRVKSNPLRRFNYFFTVLLREKAALINTVFVFGFAVLFLFIAKSEPFMLHFVWCIFAVNTPVTTMFSGDKALLRQEKMLPRQSRLMTGLYSYFLAAYFAITNAFTVLLFVIAKAFDMYVLLTGLALVVLETGIILLLERKYPIRSWQTKQEVWRNPRKYILPLIVFVVTTVPFFLNGSH